MKYMKGGQQTPVNILGLNGHFVCLEKDQTKKINHLTKKFKPREIILLANVILKHVLKEK